MRLLVLYQARDVQKDHPGYHDGFLQLLAQGQLSAYRALPYIGITEQHDWQTLWSVAEKEAGSIDADAILLHFFQSRMPDPSSGLLRLKGLPSRPLIFASLGDGYGRFGKRLPEAFRTTARLCDGSFLTGMGYVARQLEAAGATNLVYVPHGVCQLRFGAPVDVTSYAPQADVVFIGNHWGVRNPLSDLYWAERRRIDFVRKFCRRYGNQFYVYGRNWNAFPCDRGLAPFEEQHSIYRNSRVVVGGMPYVYYDFYTSDREFIALASGVPVVNYWGQKLDRLFENGQHWWLGRTTDDMIRLCDMLLSMDDGERLEVGSRARQAVMARHTQYHRCRDMLSVMQTLRRARSMREKAMPPTLDFLAVPPSPGDDSAVMNWKS